MKNNLGLSIFLAFTLTGCSILRLSSGKVQSRIERSPVEISPAAAPTVPTKPFAEKELEAKYYYDLGPARIDVSGYPQSYQKKYEIFSKACSQCHTLARPINSHRTSYIAWKYYVMEMRLRSRFKSGVGFAQEQAQEILDFLTYDSMVRKEMHREDFEESSQRLERRFNDVLAERMKRLQQQAPKPRRSYE